MNIRLALVSLLLLVVGGCGGSINPAAGGSDGCGEALTCCPEGQLSCTGDVDDKIVCVCEVGWDCVGDDCRAAAPAPDGGGSWDCGYDPEFGYACSKPGSIDDPTPGGGGDWNCTFDGELQQWNCVRSFPPNPSNSASGAGSWSCQAEGDSVHCLGGGSSNTKNGTANNNNGGSSNNHVGPTPCEPSKSTDFQFIDTLDGDPDGELAVLGNTEPHEACGVVMVSKTGYYNIYDKYLAESCTDQLDETGYLTITNSCNTSGAPVTTNAPGAYVVVDNDNTKACTADGDCGAGETCSAWYGGKCCVPSEPVFMGRFVLVAGEANKICLRHWCPRWEKAKAAGNDIGFIHHGCKQTNSIHLKFDAETLMCWDGFAEPTCP